MLHGDVQYAHEKIPELIKPLLNNEPDAVFGSRMLRGNPLSQGMPIWKYVGNKFLTAAENLALGMHLSEYHSGFRAYSCKALRQLPISQFTDGYHFDTEIIIALRKANMRIKEIAIPTHYGPESHQISLLKSLKYGFEILKLIYSYSTARINNSKN